MNAGNVLCAGDGIDGDFSTGGELGPEDAGEQRRAEADSGEITHERATIESGHLHYLIEAGERVKATGERVPAVRVQMLAASSLRRDVSLFSRRQSFG